MFVLAHLSDPHLAPLPRPRSARTLVQARARLPQLAAQAARDPPRRVLAALVADLKAQTPDHIAVTGDLVNLSLTNEFAPARAWLDGLGDPRDVTLVPGNHDTYVRSAADDLRERTGPTTCAATAAKAFPSCGGAARWR